MRLPFAFQATLLLLPVLVLAVMAAAGIRAQRAAVWSDAESAARTLLRDTRQRLTRELESAVAAAPVIRPYPAVPVSGPPSPEAIELDRARSLPAAESTAALHALLASPGRTGVPPVPSGVPPDAALPAPPPASSAPISPGVPLTAAGLPVPALAVFELLSLDQSPSALTLFTDTILTRAPSVLTPEFLRRATAFFPETAVNEHAALRDATAHWQNAEALRELLPTDAPDTFLTITTRGPVAGPARLPSDPEAWRALSPDQTKNVLESALASSSAAAPTASFPEWGRLVLLVNGAPFDPNNKSPDSNPNAAVLAAESFPPLRLEVRVVNPDALFARQRQLAWWAGGVLGVSVLTAATGMTLMRRTLARERRLNALKSDFVSSVSHELRAPVGSIRLMADALAANTVLREGQAAEFHRLIARESARLSSLIENVLDFARIEDGRKVWHFAETDLAALVTDTVKVMEPAAEARGVRLQCHTDPPPRVPVADAAAVQQALVNLLDNALKFSPPAGLVSVGLTGDDTRWTLTVSDEGPGVPEAERARIFERFYRPGGELRRETQGTGIGLSLVKHIAEAHGGCITADTAPGGGTGARFTLACPWTPPAAPAA